MKVLRTNTVSSRLQIITIVTVLLLLVCFIASAVAVRNQAEADCIDHIQQTTVQMTDMFVRAMDQSQKKLTLFADVLAINQSNPDEQLQAQMENFCHTQTFTALCIHRADGSCVSYGEHPHEDVVFANFHWEAARLPYVSQVYKTGSSASEQYVYLAVPIIRAKQVVAILYGYIPLSVLPTFISSTAYDGEGDFFIVDGATGDLLMDDLHETLGNLYDASDTSYEARRGYSEEQMHEDVRQGKSGYYVFRSAGSNEWYYTYTMPIGINDWVMQMTIDETTAFASFDKISNTVVFLAVFVMVLVLLQVALFMWHNRIERKKEKRHLDRSNYISRVQRTLINAHNNPDFVGHALKLISEKTHAETGLLLTFENKKIRDAYYWPSKDKNVAMNLIGLSIVDDFPVLYDALSVGETVVFDGTVDAPLLSENALHIFESLEVSNIMLVPIHDMAGILKGTVASVNMADVHVGADALTCVTYDLLMAINNLENHRIIRNMGAMDYLTGVKNSNSYEAELEQYSTLEADSLWCVFVDVNGLHEVNNTQGHKAGDRMLCTVASVVKRIFGEACTYRLGGDEFVAFMTDSSHEHFMNCKYRMTSELAKLGYFVSVGFECVCKNENHVFDVEAVVAAAEMLMYKEKQKFYERNPGISLREHVAK